MEVVYINNNFDYFVQLMYIRPGLTVQRTLSSNWTPTASENKWP